MALKNEYDLTTNKRLNAETAAHLTLICLYYESDFFPFVYGFLLLPCSYRSLCCCLLCVYMLLFRRNWPDRLYRSQLSAFTNNFQIEYKFV